MIKEAYYFSHDSNARYDPKISAMRSVYGTIGYGYYWIIVEMLREQEGYKLDIKSKYVWNAYALQMQCEVNACKEFILDCVNEFGLFDSDGEFFWSESLNKRMEKREKVRESKRKSAQARWNKAVDTGFDENEDANVMHMHNERNADVMLVKESKGKERKGKEIESNNKELTVVAKAKPKELNQMNKSISIESAIYYLKEQYTVFSDDFINQYELYLSTRKHNKDLISKNIINSNIKSLLKKYKEEKIMIEALEFAVDSGHTGFFYKFENKNNNQYQNVSQRNNDVLNEIIFSDDKNYLT